MDKMGSKQENISSLSRPGSSSSMVQLEYADFTLTIGLGKTDDECIRHSRGTNDTET